MNKQKLIAYLTNDPKYKGLSKAAMAEIVQSIFDHMVMAISRKKKFSYPGFGSFVIRKRKKRFGKNPKTGKSIQIPARKTILFRPFEEMKDKVKSK